MHKNTLRNLDSENICVRSTDVPNKSIKSNLIARTLVSVTEFGFALFCFPYIARILSPSNIGAIDYINSVTAYLVTLSTFGVSEYGIREVARSKRNANTLTAVLSNLFKVRFFTAITTFCLFNLLIPLFFENIELFRMASLLILVSIFNFVWALEGVEDFSHIALSKVISKVLFAIYLVSFVTQRVHLERYIYGLVFFDFLFFILTFYRLKMNNQIKIGLKTFLKMPSPTLMKNLYHTFVFIILQSSITGIPSIIMGKLNLLTALGYFSVAQRFFWMSFYAMIPLSTVLLSRSLSYMENEKGKSEHLNLAALSIFSLCFPISMGLLAISNQTVLLFVGQEYLESITLLKASSILITVLSVNNFWSMQIVFSNKGEKTLLKVNFFGFLLVTFTSLILIPHFSAMGAVSSLLITHLALLAVYFYIGSKYFSMKKIRIDLLKVVISGVLMFLLVDSLNFAGMAGLVIQITLGMLSYFLCLLILKHPIALSFFKSAKIFNFFNLR